ncbi:MAG: hypothetical protein IPL49_11505 [Saprospirales bacterium]|nr:hypothetical protein [Saprospirales bacterium]MBK8491479.1 hypothetical protein [Saprospirales bacterium]
MKTLLILLLFLNAFLMAQEPIYLKNPSFEDSPKQGAPPQGWTTCGFDGETPPDVQPSGDIQYTFFGVTQSPYAGKTYLGMVTRDNDTWESVSTNLKEPLRKGVEYQFSLFLCRSNKYISQSRLDFKATNYTTPAVLRIWAGNGSCPSGQLLAQSPPIDHSDWREYRFTFVSDGEWEVFRLEACFGPDTGGWPANGNILVDNCSAIVPAGSEVSLPETSALPNLPPTTQKLVENMPPPYRPFNPEAPLPAKTDPVFTVAELLVMDAEQLEDYLVWWFQQPKPLKGYSWMVFNVWKFETAVEETGLVSVIESLGFSEFGVLVEDLQSIGAEKTLELVEQVGRISRKPENLRSAEEQALYLAADDIFGDNEITEPLWQKRLEYIETHQKTIAKELGAH